MQLVGLNSNPREVRRANLAQTPRLGDARSFADRINNMRFLHSIDMYEEMFRRISMR
jgi:hypothetical protein